MPTLIQVLDTGCAIANAFCVSVILAPAYANATALIRPLFRRLRLVSNRLGEDMSNPKSNL